MGHPRFGLGLFYGPPDTDHGLEAFEMRGAGLVAGKASRPELGLGGWVKTKPKMMWHSCLTRLGDSAFAGVLILGANCEIKPIEFNSMA